MAFLRGSFRLVRIVAHLVVAMLATVWWRRRPDMLAGVRQRWYQRLLRIAGVEVVWRGAEPAPGLLVANHVSWLDIPVIGARLNPVFVAKSEIARWPIVGRLARWNATLFIRRGGHETDAMRASIGAILRGNETVGGTADPNRVGGGRVALFPEGTTSDGRQVLRFHSRLFAPAADDGHRVQPLAISYRLEPGEAFSVAAFIDDVPLTRSIWGVLSRPVTRVDVTVIEPVRPAGRSRDDLARITADRIAKTLGVAVVRRPARDVRRNRPAGHGET